MAVAALQAACGAGGAEPVTDAGAGAGGSGTTSSATTSASSSSGAMLTPEERLRERLAPTLSDLTQPPFGTAAAVTAVNGTLAVTLAKGTLWNTGPAADEGTYFNVASVSKLLTAARVVSLAAAGKLGLDDSVAMHLPGVKLLGTGGVDESGTVTIRQLLEHQSGLPKQPPDVDAKIAGMSKDPALLTKITESWEIQLAAPPGQYLYSNFGYALLGAIVEREGQCSFADCMASYLTELGMKRSSFWPGTLDADAARGRVDAQGSIQFWPPSAYENRYAIPYMGLWTSMPDLAHFGKTLGAAALDPAAPLFAMSEGNGHGLGPVHGERLGAPSLEHDGSAPGFYADLVVIPTMDIVLAVATSGGNEVQDEVAAFSDIVGAAVEAVPDP